ncbi:MAG: SNF2-related protein [bacterium]
MSGVDIFERLKRKKKISIKKKRPASSIFFQLHFNEIGAYITVVDKDRNEVEPDFEYYTGRTHDILKSIAAIRDKSNFRINWEIPDNKIYLSEHEYLLWQLQHCNNFVDAQFRPIGFMDGLAKIVVSIEGEDTLAIKIFLLYQGKGFKEFSFLNENYVFAEGNIYKIPPVGENFKELHLFQTSLLPMNLEKYLSLLYSYFENIFIDYQDYKQIEGEIKESQPTLIFEKIDADNSLYIRLTTSLPGFDADFFDNYDITRIAALNVLEKKIIISDITSEEIHFTMDEIETALKRYRKSVADKNDYFVEDNLFIIEESLAREFIYNELGHFITRFVILGAEKLKSYNIRPVSPKLTFSLSHGIDFLEGDVNLEVEGENFSLFDALTQYKKNSYILLSDGTCAIINKHYIEKLKRVFKKQKDKVRVSFFDLPIVEEMIDEKVAAESLKWSREIFLGFNRLEESRYKFPQLNEELRGYQKQGYKWIRYLHQHSLGGCLADDMGLGKTVQAIALLSFIYPDEKKPSLIIMPKTLLFNWANEINKFNPQLSYYLYHGNNRNLEEAKKSNLILTTYAMVRNDIEQFKEEEFYYIILDESQNIKNINSQISKAVMLLSSKHRLALSGTPIENNLSELYSLFRFLNPSMFSSIDDFNQSYIIPIQKENDKDVLYELKKKIYPFVLRRLKKEVLKDLPDKIEQILFVDMSQEQQIFYENRRRFYYQTVKTQIAQSGLEKSQFFIFQALSELRQIASIPESKSQMQIISPKREALLDNIMDVVANDHKVLLFANFLDVIDCVSADLEKAGIEYLTMTGATKDRKQLVEAFQNDDTYKVFLMTLKTGGLGLNLTAADYIFIFDPWWNKAAEEQAIDRTHRIGQDKTVFSYKLITKGTIEEKILELQKRKKVLFESLISSDGLALKTLDNQDIEFVLGE